MKASHWYAMGESVRRFAWRGLSVLASFAFAVVPFAGNLTVQTSFSAKTSVAQRTMLESIKIIPLKSPEWLPRGLPYRLQHLREMKGATGQPLHLEQQDLKAIQQAEVGINALNPDFWYVPKIRWALAVQPFFSGFGDLTEDLSRRPEKWSEKGETSWLEPTKAERQAMAKGTLTDFPMRIRMAVKREVDQVPRAGFVRIGSPSAPNLRFLRARGAFLVNADFRGADLTGADLSETDLRGSLWRDDTVNVDRGFRSVNLSFCQLDNADLTSVDMEGATLIGASIEGAILSGANLSRAILTGASLAGTALTGIDLTEATVTGANLYEANLTGANLEGANLTGAYVSGTNFADCLNLDEAELNGANYPKDRDPIWPYNWKTSNSILICVSSEGQPKGAYRLVPFTHPKWKKPYIRLERVRHPIKLLQNTN